MKKIDNFINIYPVSKTLKFRLLPQGKTLENLQKDLIVDSDEKLADNYKKIKKIIDNYHKSLINKVLSSVSLTGLEEYYSIFSNSSKETEKQFEACEKKLRLQIVKAFSNNDEFKRLFTKDLIQKDLLSYVTEQSDIDLVKSFYSFTTYFTGFNENRKNMYDSEEKSTSIAYRSINQNLSKYASNINILNVIASKYDELYCEISSLDGYYYKDFNLIDIEGYNNYLSQLGIEKYNVVIGEINKLINLFSQKNKVKIPLLKILYKQILSDKVGLLFNIQKFNSDKEVISSINNFYKGTETNKGVVEILEDIKRLFVNFESFNFSNIFINASNIAGFSNAIYKNWSTIKEGWCKSYDNKTTKAIADIEKYQEKREKDYKKIKFFNLKEIKEFSFLANKKLDINIGEAISEIIKNITEEILFKWKSFEDVVISGSCKKLIEDDKKVLIIKELLDSIKSLQEFLKLFLIDDALLEKDCAFYDKFDDVYNQLVLIVDLYNKCRNYLTQKPFSEEKIKINFNNSQFLNGWDVSKERDYGCILLKKGNKYFLGVINKKHNKIFEKDFDCCDDCCQKLYYKLLPGPNKMLPKVFFAKNNIDYYAPSKRIIDIYEKGTFKQGEKFNLDHLHELIDFYKESIAKNKDWADFNFKFKASEDYNNIADFYSDVQEQGYKISFKNLPITYVEELVESGKLYLFEIYNKDFSSHSKGNKNLHTLYFEMLFKEENLKNIVYALNGGAEMFYRKASLKRVITHPKNIGIERKNPNNLGKSFFVYDLIKNKRYTEDQFFLHLPITLNFKAKNKDKLNQKVKEVLKSSENNYIIGIDRGERNLLSVVVMNDKKEIVEQKSLNIINNMDYRALLDNREIERDLARRNWQNIESIKNIKNGYLSLAVNEVCKLIVKYDAIVVLEDLNVSFKQSRVKFEKQVYQNFEKMLIDKLNFYCDKTENPGNNGGVLKAYQLTEKFDSFNNLGKQSGFLFYVPAWLTSKIDPATGFANLIKLKYYNVEQAREFFNSLNFIKYNKEGNYLEFALNYESLPTASITCEDYKKEWVLCSYGERIKTVKDNMSFDYKTISLTNEFINLFNDYNINYGEGDIKEAVVKQNDKDFYERFIHLFNLMLQLRNSNPKTGEDYILSPVKNANGYFFDSRKSEDSRIKLPVDADANGAYHIALKGLWAIEQIKTAEDLKKVNLSISKKDWLKYVQTK